MPSPPASTTAHRPELPRSSIRIDFTRLSIISPFFDLFARSGVCETPSVTTTSLSDPLQGCRDSVDTLEGCSHIDYSRSVNNTSPLPIKSLGRKYRYLAASRNSGGKCPSPESATDCHQDGLFRGCAGVCVSVCAMDREMPSFFILAISVVLFSPSRAAAP